MWCLTTSFSRTVENRGRTDIGRKSDGFCRTGILGIEVIWAVFHCRGTVDWESDSWYRWANGSARKGAARRENHGGMLSQPMALVLD